MGLGRLGTEAATSGRVHYKDIAGRHIRFIIAGKLDNQTIAEKGLAT